MTTSSDTDGPEAPAGDDADSLGVALPREWIELPVERAGFDRFCGDLRRRWADDEAWDRTKQRQAELLLSRIRRDLLRAGLQFAAAYVSSPSDEDRAAAAPPVGDDLEQDPAADDALMATCTVGTYTKESFGARLDLTLANLTMAFGRRPDADAEAGGADGKPYRRIVNLEPPAFHTLPLGTSVRLRRLYELHEPGPLPQRFFGETFLVPLDDGQRCVVAHFTTINLQLARVFSELFEAIAGTLTLFRPDDPTEFESTWVES